MRTVIVRKRGAIVIPVALREQYGLDEGVAIALDEGPDGLLQLRPLRTAEDVAEAQFWEQLTKDYAALRADPVASAEYDAEFAEWDSMNDGLEDEPPYPNA